MSEAYLKHIVFTVCVKITVVKTWARFSKVRVRLQAKSNSQNCRVAAITAVENLKKKLFFLFLNKLKGKYEITIDGEKPNDGANPGGQTSTLNSTLVIKGVSTGDNTSYECMGRNLYGSHKKKFYIVVEGESLFCLISIFILAFVCFQISVKFFV